MRRQALDPVRGEQPVQGPDKLGLLRVVARGDGAEHTSDGQGRGREVRGQVAGDGYVEGPGPAEALGGDPLVLVLDLDRGGVSALGCVCC